MIRSVVLALTLLVAVSGHAEGQDRRDQNNGSDHGPIGTLLQLRAELGLSDDQVVRLTAIEQANDDNNRPHVEQLMGLRRRMLSLGPRRRFDPASQALYDSYQAEMRPLLKKIEKNNHAAMQEVGSVLSDSQRRQLWQVLQQRKENRDRGGNSSRLPYGN